MQENKAQFLQIAYVCDENKLVQWKIFSCTKKRNKLNGKRKKKQTGKKLFKRERYIIFLPEIVMLK